MSIFILLMLQEEPGGMRNDGYIATFRDLAEAQSSVTKLDKSFVPVWKELTEGSGPFESHHLWGWGIRPTRVFESQEISHCSYAVIEIAL